VKDKKFKQKNIKNLIIYKHLHTEQQQQPQQQQNKKEKQ
jgi:hypothetical protein